MHTVPRGRGDENGTRTKTPRGRVVCVCVCVETSPLLLSLMPAHAVALAAPRRVGVVGAAQPARCLAGHATCDAARRRKRPARAAAKTGRVVCESGGGCPLRALSGMAAAHALTAHTRASHKGGWPPAHALSAAQPPKLGAEQGACTRGRGADARLRPHTPRGPAPPPSPPALACSAALAGRPHAVEEAREGVPVVKHEVAHAQEGDLLQPPRARRPAKGALRYPLKRVVVVPAGTIT